MDKNLNTLNTLTFMSWNYYKALRPKGIVIPKELKLFI
jgi:hypothetical protein